MTQTDTYYPVRGTGSDGNSVFLRYSSNGEAWLYWEPHREYRSGEGAPGTDFARVADAEVPPERLEELTTGLCRGTACKSCNIQRAAREYSRVAHANGANAAVASCDGPDGTHTYGGMLEHDEGALERISHGVRGVL